VAFTTITVTCDYDLADGTDPTGTVTFTPELSSGYTSGFYYGFEFADDEAQLKQLFDDNLPFALDVIESARDPFGYVSATTLGHSDRIVLESVSPDVRVTCVRNAVRVLAASVPSPRRTAS
jgi:hypothetical protein